MSIADQITRLQGVKQSIINSIKNKGVVVSDSTMLDECPTLIDAIPQGGAIGIKNFRIGNTALEYNEGTLLGGSSGTTNTAYLPTILGNRQLFTRQNSYEVNIAAYRPNTTDYSNFIICGASSSYNRYFSIELWHSHIVFLLASTKSWGSIAKVIQYDCLGKLMHLNISHTANTDNFVYKISEDGINWISESDTNLSDVSYAYSSSDNFIIGGIYNHNDSIVCKSQAYIDLTKSYIKVNGIFQ